MTLEEHVELLSKLRKEKEQKEDAVKEVNAKIEEQHGHILQFLETSGINSAKTPFGTVGIREFMQVTSPKSPEQKAAFKAWLLEKVGAEGVEALLSINATTLKAMVSKELEARKEAGNLDATIPGIEEIKTYNTISFRSK